jgi:sirohydrochlorin cobaltochelatase
MKAIVLFAHGSRDPLWHGPINAIAGILNQRAPGILVRCAYLELTKPNLLDTAQELVSLGCTELQITPLFLGVGKHAREDLPQLVNQLKETFPNLNIKCAPPVGEDSRVLHQIAEVALNAQLDT